MTCAANETYVGCYAEAMSDTEGDREFPVVSRGVAAVDDCRQLCKQEGFAYAAQVANTSTGGTHKLVLHPPFTRHLIS